MSIAILQNGDYTEERSWKELNTNQFKFLVSGKKINKGRLFNCDSHVIYLK